MSPTFVFAVVFWLSCISFQLTCPEVGIRLNGIAALICGLFFGVLEILDERDK